MQMGNKFYLVVFGGVSGNNKYLNDILILDMDRLDLDWETFIYQRLPYNNIIRGGHVTWLDAQRCEMMFVGWDYLYACSSNFNWTTSIIESGPKISNFVPIGINSFQECIESQINVN